MIGRRTLVKSLLTVPFLGVLPGRVLAKDDISMSVTQSKSQTVLVVPGQTIQNQPLDNFVARSVTVDNPSGQWFYLPNQQRWIAPYTLGTIIALNSGQEGASSVQSGASLVNIQSQTPSGQVSRPTSGQQATFVYSTDAHPNAAGSALQTGVQRTRLVIGNGHVAPGGSNVLICTYTVPDGVVAQIDLLTMELSETVSAQQGSVVWVIDPNDGTGAQNILFITSTTAINYTSVPLNILLQPGQILTAHSSNSDTTQFLNSYVAGVIRELRTV